jgi:hypothetical protein
LLQDLISVDSDRAATSRVLQMETLFRSRVAQHVQALPQAAANFQDFSTSPFVIAIYSRWKGYSRISQVEQDILPAKLFSSMETSAGRMVEDVTLPVYGWAPVPSTMHTSNSALDGIRLVGGTLRAATLKSGPRCLNDEMSENFADAVISHACAWLTSHRGSSLDFSYGVLYGTKKQSNKKDWHILRNLYDKLKAPAFTVDPVGRWHCEFTVGGQPVTATVRVGKEWWDYLGGPTCLTEVCVALIRACVVVGPPDPPNHRYVMGDLGQIVDATPAAGIMTSILQQSQYPWLFFLMRHFCDALV